MSSPHTDDHLIEVVDAFRRLGSQESAARELGLTRASLRRRIAAAKKRGLFRHEDKAFDLAMVSAQTTVVPNGMWIKTKHDEDGIARSMFFKKPELDALSLAEKLTDAFNNVIKVSPSPAPVQTEDDLLTAYLLPDAHIGQLSWSMETGAEYNTEIACKRVKEWVARAVTASPPSGTAVVLGLGDLLHADDQTNATPAHKHQLDVSTRHYETMTLAVEAMATAVDLALVKHNSVIVRILPGNHDPHASIAVTLALAERYRLESRVSVVKDPTAFFIYEFGSVMLAAAHGDKQTPERMVMFMADQFSDVWGRTKHRRLFTGHLHSLKSKTVGGCEWEQLSAMTEKDAYAFNGAFSGRPEMQAVTYHRESGEISRVRIR